MDLYVVGGDQDSFMRMEWLWLFKLREILWRLESKVEDQSCEDKDREATVGGLNGWCHVHTTHRPSSQFENGLSMKEGGVAGFSVIE